MRRQTSARFVLLVANGSRTLCGVFLKSDKRMLAMDRLLAQIDRGDQLMLLHLARHQLLRQNW